MATVTYGPLPADKVAAFESFLAEVVGPACFTRRGGGAETYFDLSVMPSPLVDVELQNIVNAQHLRPADFRLAGDRGPQYREGRINIFDSARADPWSAASGLQRTRSRSVFADIPWKIF